MSLVDETGLHLVAWLSVRFRSPRTAKRIVDAAAAVISHPFPDREAARRAALRLSNVGTCLTRAMTIAARLPGSYVVIGRRFEKDAPFLAHAWVEQDGVALEPVDEGTVEIARIR
jgi:Transglutaminase-like superfamily